jgi:hypothetical protein
MHNFFDLSIGDKWAATGTKFKPLNSKGFPDLPVGSQSFVNVSVYFDFWLYILLTER